jgi:hypothetical protein
MSVSLTILLKGFSPVRLVLVHFQVDFLSEWTQLNHSSYDENKYLLSYNGNMN